MRALLCLQYWEGDRAQALDLMKLIAANEDKKRQDVDIMFCSRFDCEHDQETVLVAQEKFSTVHLFRSDRQASGWPWGPNELWFSTITEVWQRQAAARMPAYDTILTFEGDCCPLQRDWLDCLLAEWQRTRPAKVMGALQSAPGPHINGNAFFDGDRSFTGWIRDRGSCSPHSGWDYELAPAFKRFGWADTPLMRSYWQKPSIDAKEFAELQRAGVVFLHGVKDGTAREIFRKKCLYAPDISR